MPRILPRGEIESLDHTLIPRVRLPVVATVFADRARRLRQLAASNPLADYLELIANIVDAQHRALTLFPVPGPEAQVVAMTREHGMPPVQALGWARDPVWLEILRYILHDVQAAETLPAVARQVCADLDRMVEHEPRALEDMADALIARFEGVDSARAPFVMAALQTMWTRMVGELSVDDLAVSSPFGVCPCCGSKPVASIVRVGAQIDGCRYLSCPLCSTEWHLVRVICSHCEDTETVAYHNIEDSDEGIKAESCDKCQSYRKIFYQQKVPEVDAVADDLASLPLDILMGEAGYSRASDNPFLWQDP